MCGDVEESMMVCTGSDTLLVQQYRPQIHRTSPYRHQPEAEAKPTGILQEVEMCVTPLSIQSG